MIFTVSLVYWVKIINDIKKWQAVSVSVSDKENVCIQQHPQRLSQQIKYNNKNVEIKKNPPFIIDGKPLFYDNWEMEFSKGMNNNNFSPINNGN